MTAHDHRTYVDGCFRCDLSADEVRQTYGEPCTCPSEAVSWSDVARDITTPSDDCYWHGDPLNVFKPAPHRTKG